MKIYLIKASSGSDYSKYKAQTGGPPQNIFAAAAATPKTIDIEMTDETIGMKTNFQSHADLVVIFMSTPDAYRAYDLADKFMSTGKTVILGGLHTKFNPGEAQQHAHALIMGEVENYWQSLLEDFQRKALKPLYQSDAPVDLNRLNPYPTHIIPLSKYDYTWSVVVSRGCPYQCQFCLVHEFFSQFQLRGIEHIVKELEALKALGVKWVELHSDNLTHNREYALELFQAIAPLKLNFYGETTILIARDQHLLGAAQKAGLKMLLIGIETPSAQALKSQKKSFVKPNKIKDDLATIKSYGIEVQGDFLFGFDEHDSEIFQHTEQFIQEIKLDKVYPHMMIPFPGSKNFDNLEKSGRILTKDWSKYDGSHVVHQPQNISPEALSDGVYRFWEKHTGLKEKLKYWFSWR